jgi:hypothetical protein
MIGLDCLDKAAGNGGQSEYALPLAFTRYDACSDGDQTLSRCARDLQNAGYSVSGIVQSNRQRRGRRACDMFLQNLTTGEEFCITADRGNGARVCRLDHAALAQATLWAEQALALNPQLLILNKFGKKKAPGRGFVPVMADALSFGIPVLTGISALNRTAAQAVTGGAGTRIEPNHKVSTSERFPGQRGGVKAGQRRGGWAGMRRGPIGPLLMPAAKIFPGSIWG